METGDRIFTVLKAYGMRQGLTRYDDTWPERFFNEPLTGGSAKGAVLSKDTISGLLDEYYGLRGWDIKRGMPGREKLLALGLEDIAEDLSKLGKLPP
jgi:aldehyde:ferredoxin oxidoreductase